MAPEGPALLEAHVARCQQRLVTGQVVGAAGIAGDVHAHACDHAILGLVLAIDDPQHVHGGICVDSEKRARLGPDSPPPGPNQRDIASAPEGRRLVAVADGDAQRGDRLDRRADRVGRERGIVERRFHRGALGAPVAPAGAEPERSAPLSIERRARERHHDRDQHASADHPLSDLAYTHKWRLIMRLARGALRRLECVDAVVDRSYAAVRLGCRSAGVRRGRCK